VFVLAFGLTVLALVWFGAEPNSVVDAQDAVPAGPHELYLPVTFRQPTPTPTSTPTPEPLPPTGWTYESIAVDPYLAPDRIDYLHADWNLELRGWAPTSAYLGLVHYSGDTDANAPLLKALFSPQRQPVITAVYQVYNWNWGVPPDPGTRGSLITAWPVTLMQLQASYGELVYLPYRAPDIYQNRLQVQVLYATDDQIAFTYTRDGTVANGYTVHITNIYVDPNLVSLYQQNNAAGRHYLPALANGQAIGRAKAGGILVAIRDRGSFMDPRSNKDWWRY